MPTDRVIGRAFAIVWPFSHAAVLEIPETFDPTGTAGGSDGDSRRARGAARHAKKGGFLRDSCCSC